MPFFKLPTLVCCVGPLLLLMVAAAVVIVVLDVRWLIFWLLLFLFYLFAQLFFFLFFFFLLSFFVSFPFRRLLTIHLLLFRRHHCRHLFVSYCSPYASFWSIVSLSYCSYTNVAESDLIFLRFLLSVERGFFFMVNISKYNEYICLSLLLFLALSYYSLCCRCACSVAVPVLIFCCFIFRSHSPPHYPTGSTRCKGK